MILIWILNQTTILIISIPYELHMTCNKEYSYIICIAISLLSSCIFIFTWSYFGNINSLYRYVFSFPMSCIHTKSLNSSKSLFLLNIIKNITYHIWVGSSHQQQLLGLSNQWNQAVSHRHWRDTYCSPWSPCSLRWTTETQDTYSGTHH